MLSRLRKHLKHETAVPKYETAVSKHETAPGFSEPRQHGAVCPAA
jgi:hypothetical protein